MAGYLPKEWNGKRVAVRFARGRGFDARLVGDNAGGITVEPIKEEDAEVDEEARGLLRRRRRLEDDEAVVHARSDQDREQLDRGLPRLPRQPLSDPVRHAPKLWTPPAPGARASSRKGQGCCARSARRPQ